MQRNKRTPKKKSKFFKLFFKKLLTNKNLCAIISNVDGKPPENKENRHSSLAQSVERMTVNHDVAGSSPAGGAKKFRTRKCAEFLLITSSLFTFH